MRWAGVGEGTRAGRIIAPLVAGLCGAVCAVAAAYLILPQGTVNLDELVYLNQAEAIRHGRLTYDAASYDPDFRPYLTGVDGDRVVFKYQPLWPLWLAISQAATGDHRAGLVVAGAAAALAVWLLTRELTGKRWLGTVAAAGLAASPVFLAHSATALAYLPASALAAFAVAATLRSVRTDDLRWAALAGAGFGALFFHRPFDAALAGIPVAIWHVHTARAWRPVAAVLLGATPFLVAWVAYNEATTGEPLTPAFSVDAPDDRFGFGRRASWQPATTTFEDDRLDYTVGEAAVTVAQFAAVTPMWLAGGIVSLGLAAVAASDGWHDPRRRLLVAIIAAVVGGHFFWWGTGNFLQFSLHVSLGPAYWLAALGPMLALAVQGGCDVIRAHRPQARTFAVVLVLAALANWTYAGVRLGDAHRGREQQVAALGLGDADLPADSIVLSTNALGDPFVRVLVPADLAAGARLHAVDLDSAEQLFRLRDRFPDRSLWAWLPERPIGTGLEPFTAASLERLPPLPTGQPTVTVHVTPGDAVISDAWLRIVDDHDVELRRQPLARVADQAVTSTLPAPAEPAWLAAGVDLRHEDGSSSRHEIRWAVRAGELIGPGRDHRLYDLGGEHWVIEDVSRVMTAEVAGLPDEPPRRRLRVESPKDPDEPR